MSVITLVTDFGTGSPYVAAMKGVILSINPAATIVDITHEIPAQDVRRGAVVLEDVAEYFPADAIHVGVIDPGVGTQRAIVYARIGQQSYVAPDNGLLGRLVRRMRPSKIICLEDRQYWLEPVSDTFHGRDIMAPVAARLSLGLDPDRLGPPLEEIGQIDRPEIRVTPSRIEGVVLEADSFGNLRTNIPADLLASRPTDERMCVICSIYETWGIFRTYADQPHGTFIALVGSSNHLELAIVGDSAAGRLGIHVGEQVILAWE